MSQTGVFLLLILGAALLVETAYQLATGGAVSGDASRYPTAQAFARQAGLAPKPAQPRAAVAKPTAVPPPSSAPASTAAPASSTGPAPAAQPAKAATKPAAAKVRPPHRSHSRAGDDRAPPSATLAPPPASPPPPSPPQAPITAPY